MVQPVITRESILNGTIRRLVEQSGDDGRLMTDQEREQIVEKMIETAPSRDSIWIFGYGSLIWNPAVHFTEKLRGKVHGYHRSFCLWSTIWRGSPSKPGLMLGLERGGSCNGIFYKIDRREIRSELDRSFVLKKATKNLSKIRAFFLERKRGEQFELSLPRPST